MNVKKCLFATLTVCATTFAPTASTQAAEQPAAEQYRQMLKSGNFYAEYQITRFSGDWKNEFVPVSVAAKDGNRAERVLGTNKIAALKGGGAGIFRGEIDVSNLGGHSAHKFPEVFYKDNKYYRLSYEVKMNAMSVFVPFSGAKIAPTSALMLTAERFNAGDYDVTEGWAYIKSDLSLPEEMLVFYWNDPYHENRLGKPAPVYTGSSERTIDEKNYVCDQYVSDVKSIAGTLIAREVYNMLYDAGNLVRVQKYFVRDGKETLLTDIEVRKFTAEVPEDAFSIAQKIPVFEAVRNDMSGLLGEKTSVGSIGGKENAK